MTAEGGDSRLCPRRAEPAVTYEQIKQTYDGEWVLIAYKEVDDDLQVVEGKVIAHSPNREEIYSLLATVEEQPLAIEYLGQIPEDLAFVM